MARCTFPTIEQDVQRCVAVLIFCFITDTSLHYCITLQCPYISFHLTLSSHIANSACLHYTHSRLTYWLRPILPDLIECSYIIRFLAEQVNNTKLYNS